MIEQVGGNKKKYVGELYLLLMTILWGGTFVIIKDSLQSVSPLLFISIRFSIAFVFMLPLLLYKKVRIRKEPLIAGLVLGILMFFSYATQTVGLKFTSATKSAFITGTCVVMIPFVQTFVEKRFPTKGAIAGTVFVFTGVIFLSSGGNSMFSVIDELGSNFNAGDFITLICAILFAFHVVYLDILSQKHDYLILVTSQILSSAVLGFITAFILNETGVEGYHLVFDMNLVWGLIYTAIVATVISITIQTKYQKEVTPTKAGIIYSFEPIFAALFAFFLLNEKMTNFGIIGCVLIFSGLIVSETYDSLVKDGRFKKTSGNNG